MKHFLIVLILQLTSMHCGSERPKPVPITEQKIIPQMVVPIFDKNKAFSYLTAQTDFGPRVVSTTAHAQCLQYLQIELTKYAEEVDLQPFSHTGYDGKLLTMTNVIASFNLKATKRILLIAHWDSRSMADEDTDSKKRNQPVPGANDGASGVSVLLEIARNLKTSPAQIGIDMLFSDGEDFGKENDFENYLLGTRYFANNLPKGFTPMFGILLDMVGDKELEISKEPNSLEYAPDVVELVWSAARELGIYQFSDNTQRPVLDDHIPLNKVGIKTIDLIDFEYPYWHTTEDTPDKCSPESLEAVGKVLMYVIYRQK